MGDDEEPKAMMDSDEEDEDYVPGADPDAPAGEDENDAAVSDADADAPVTLSITKQKAVDDAFFDLFGYHYNAPSAPGGKSDEKMPAKGRRAMNKRQSILSSIFGSRASAKLLLHAKAVAASSRPKPSSGGMIRLEKRVVAEVKRFAGQEIRVEKVVMVPVMAGEEDKQSTNNAAVASNPEASKDGAGVGRRAKGVDNLLTELSKPEKLSTISKTSADWDLFKSKNADATLKEQLESQAKGNEAYLVKKDFLNRVDHRRFELEKKQRDRERAKRGK